MFLWNFTETVKTIWRNVGNTSYKFFSILIEILWHFLVNFWKNLWKIIAKIWKILYDFCFLQECSYHSVHHDRAKYFHTLNQLMFQFLWECEDSKLGLYGHKEKSIVSKMITNIINDRVISSSHFKIVKIYHNYNIFIKDSYFNL